MIKLRDHYFISWLKIIKGKDYFINKVEKTIEVDISSNELTDFIEEYNSTTKPVLKEIRSIVKKLNKEL